MLMRVAHFANSVVSSVLILHFKSREGLPTSWKFTFASQKEPGYKVACKGCIVEAVGEDAADHEGTGGKPKQAQPVM